MLIKKFSLNFFVSECRVVSYSWACDTGVNVVIVFKYTVVALEFKCCMIHFSLLTLQIFCTSELVCFCFSLFHCYALPHTSST